MTTGTSSQSQASYLNNIQQKPNIQPSTQQILDEQTANLMMKNLTAAMALEEGERFQACLKSLNILFQKGYSYLFMTHDSLMRKMMNHFTKLGKQIQENSAETGIELRMIFVLSVIGELLKENPKFYYPFTRKFLITVFSIDAELLQSSAYKNNILAILSVIYENFSRQPKLIKKYGMEERLKYSVLQSYYLIEELFTLKTFNKTIMNLVKKEIYFTKGELEKYQVVETVSKFISKNQIDLFLVKMKMTILMMAGK